MKDRIICSIENLCDNLIQKKELFSDDYVLASGQLGASLFLNYSGRVLNNESYIEYSITILEECFDALNNLNGYKDSSFFGGYTGLCWLYQHYINVGVIPYSDDSKYILDSFDGLIYEKALECRDNKNYDLLYGVIGYGIYFLERNKFESKIEELKKIVDIIEDISIELNNDKLVWEDLTDKDVNLESTIYNLGFAHGQPSIILFLAYSYKASKYSKALILLNKAINFMKSIEFKDERIRFPFHLINNQPSGYNGRLAWCYGDLGIGYALLKTANLISNVELKEYAVSILRTLIDKKIEDPLTGVKDASFCHGSSGVALLFHKSYQYSNCIEFYREAEKWMEITLKMKNDDGSYSRFELKENDWKFNIDYGLIEGGAGIGLSIISFLSPNFNDWEICFLL